MISLLPVGRRQVATAPTTTYGGHWRQPDRHTGCNCPLARQPRRQSRHFRLGIRPSICYKVRAPSGSNSVGRVSASQAKRAAPSPDLRRAPLDTQTLSRQRDSGRVKDLIGSPKGVPRWKLPMQLPCIALVHLDLRAARGNANRRVRSRPAPERVLLEVRGQEAQGDAKREHRHHARGLAAPAEPAAAR